MRTIVSAAALIREIDPDTGITPFRLRAWVLEGRIPHVRAGNKRLINVDILLNLLAAGDPASAAPQEAQGIIRAVDERLG
jgi:hypothetical protein